jgi:serine protease Do
MGPTVLLSLVGASLFANAARAEPLPPPLESWIQARAEEHQTYLDPLGTHASQTPRLWRERASDSPLPQFVPPTSLGPLIRSVRASVVNVLAQRPPEAAAADGLAASQQGSGFIISRDGYLVTNHHVVVGAQQISVLFPDGRREFAELIGTDAATDVALLKMKGELKNLSIAYLGNSDKLEVGDWVVAIGNPFGLDSSVAQGIISAKERVLGISEFDDFIQTDALISPGNSGGPLFNMRGEVVGINTAIVKGSSRIGFAVPINMVKELLPNLRVNGHLVRGWLGFSVVDNRGDNGNKGVWVKEVYPDSPAKAAGLKAGDRLVRVNGRTVDGYLQLLRRVAFLAPGSQVKLSLLRDNAGMELTAKLGRRPGGEEMEAISPSLEPARGLWVRELTGELAESLSLNAYSGVLISDVISGSPAHAAGLRAGDVITEMNDRRVSDLATYRAALKRASPGQSVIVRYLRDKESRAAVLASS